MKIKFCITAMVLSLLFIACKKEDKAQEADAAAATPAVKEKFVVDLNVIAAKEDNFAVYYTEDNTINFTGEKASWRGVKAETGSQLVTVELPEEVIPTDIRIDFGINKDQGDVILENFKISYYGKSFEAKGSDFLKYFIANDSVKTEIDAAKGTIKFLKNPKKYFTPFYYPQQSIHDEIAKITK